MATTSVTGVLLKTPKVIKLDPLMLILSIRDEKDNTITQCLAVKHALNVMYLAKPGCHIAVYGHLNKRRQLVIDRFMIGHASEK